MASLSSSREQSDKDPIDLMSGDPESHIITFDDLEWIDPSTPYPLTGYLDFIRQNYWREPTGEAREAGEAEGDFEPKLKKRIISAPIMSICTCSSLREWTLQHLDVYVPLAKEALAYYNAKEDSSLSFVEVRVANSQCGPKNKVHMNFVASQDGMEYLFFCELVDGCVKGCCLLQNIEHGNPIGSGCGMCGKEIIHPGPRHGCMIAGGDSFKGYDFWDYRISPPFVSKPTPDDEQMYYSCALKALEHFSSTQFGVLGFIFVDPEVIVGSSTSTCEHKIVIHVNFECVPPSPLIEKELFFAELEVPTFGTIDDGKWDVRKTPFIKVKGCCMLRPLQPGLPFGRACEICYYRCSEVIHPGPKHGYYAVIGDNFLDYEFARIGHGVF